MFSSHGESSAASAPIHQPEPTPSIADFVQLPEALTAVDLRSLPAGTELVVETRNSRYRLAMLDDRWNALVQGGRHFQQATTARIDGCTLGGSLLKPGWIAVGCRVELSVGGTRIVTSSVESISVNSDSAAA